MKEQTTAMPDMTKQQRRELKGIEGRLAKIAREYNRTQLAGVARCKKMEAAVKKQLALINREVGGTIRLLDKEANALWKRRQILLGRMGA